jgi:hypothetical protein
MAADGLNPADQRAGYPARPVGLLLKLRRGAVAGFASAASAELGRRGELLFTTRARGSGLALDSEDDGAAWVRIAAGDNPWDEAHARMRGRLGLDASELLAAEPDLEQQWLEDGAGAAEGFRADDDDCRQKVEQDGRGGRAVRAPDRWHMGAAFSGLEAARNEVSPAEQARVLIAHLDTGYDRTNRTNHIAFAQGERSFVAGDPDPASAVDRAPSGKPLTNRGHGAATLAILASAAYGGAPHARILPIRVADGVVRFSTSTLVQGFAHALEQGAHVLSMSMGGLASGALADVVNECYAAGLVMVTAAGNNFAGLPAASIVYPARYARVVAACGMMADGKPYLSRAGGGPLSLDTMAGCVGPAAKMLTAVAGFTPNIPWARIGCEDRIDEDGGGTSSATPQVAAAAALWIARHFETLQPYGGWQRGEAVRRALFESASLGSGGAPHPHFGWGHVRAAALLATAPRPEGQLSPAPGAKAGLGLIRLLTGRGLGLDGAGAPGLPGDDLVELELLQFLQRDVDDGRNSLDALVLALDIDEANEALGVEQAAGIVRAAAIRAEASPHASRTLARRLGMLLKTGAVPGTGPLPPGAAPPAPPPRGPTPPPALAKTAARRPAVPAARERRPARRRLRIFALDPTLGKQLKTFEDRVATIWVRNEPDLLPGPVGEYLEVVDLDPGSDRVYPPVDLNDLDLALADGLEPSEGNPRFHQQMVYAVGMQVIEAFEFALGRRALWAPASRFTRRLRIHPHALRDRNAYYSPEKRALLFGYFPAASRINDVTPAGTMVFTCLSSDIIAHEMAHALLDGQAPGYRDPSNPDVRAFHEGFADIVALFQQFTYTDMVRRQVARARGRLGAFDLVGAIGGQFGEGTGKAGPLRDYRPTGAPALEYGKTRSVHALGSILVSAVYRAFLAMAERAMAPYVRLATGGTGVLAEGELHPDLVAKLTETICQTARDVQKICIRALDYLPANDISFGDYLRAIVTGDLDAFPQDDSGYRVAFFEAFRHYGLHPKDLRTLSVETLRWQRPHDDMRKPGWLAPLVRALEIRPGPAELPREEIHARALRRARIFETHLAVALAADDAEGSLHRALGLERGLARFDNEGRPDPSHAGGATNVYIDEVRVKRRENGTDDRTFEVIARVRQRRPEPLDPDAPGAGRFWFRGGATLLIDPFTPQPRGGHAPEIRYILRKSMTSETRLRAERDWRREMRAGDLRAAYFAGTDEMSPLHRMAEPFALIHALRDEER